MSTQVVDVYEKEKIKYLFWSNKSKKEKGKK
jgi:hypothetical protein